ncbi:MAG: WD40 repeat domain-containing protein, partial [Nannocystaceae bacterium]|nr:WD40 repeat domain-containing protein [Nannocystaceae bacterium]
ADGRILLIETDDGAAIVRQHDKEATPVSTLMGETVSTLRWSPTSPTLVGLAVDTEEVRFYDFDTDAETIVSAPGLRRDRPVWSPDGARVAFRTLEDPSAPVEEHLATLWLASPDGGEPRKLVQHETSSGVVGFAPDGTQIAYHDDGIRIVDLNTLEVRSLDTNGVARDLVWSPTGPQIMWANLNHCGMVSAVDGETDRFISFTIGEATWSSSGRWSTCYGNPVGHTCGKNWDCALVYVFDTVAAQGRNYPRVREIDWASAEDIAAVSRDRFTGWDDTSVALPWRVGILDPDSGEVTELGDLDPDALFSDSGIRWRRG